MSTSSQFVKKLIGKQDKKEDVKPYVSKNEEWRYSVARVMLTGILKNQLGRSAEQAAEEALPLIIKASKTDPLYLLKAAAFARDANMKGMVKLGIAALSANAPNKFLIENRTAIISLLATFHPGQLMQFVDLMKSKVLGKGFGSRPQKWIKSVMEGWSAQKVEIYTLKYPKDFYSLLRLVHPSYTDSRGKLVDYILTSKGKGQPSGYKQIAIEQMKSLNDGFHETQMAKLMLDNNVPWDCVKGFHPIKGDVGLAMMTQMGLTGLLLNIRSLEQNGILDSNDAIKALKMKLKEEENGRSIPIDFAKPYIYSTNPAVKDILVESIVNSLSNSMPHIEGRRIGVSIDISGSMAGEPLITAGLLAVPFLKSKNLWFTTFDTGLYEEDTSEANKRYYNKSYDNFVVCPKLKGRTSKDQVHALLNLQTHGGTDVSISLRQALQDKRVLDLHVLITDEQQNVGTPIMTVWKEYKKHINPRAELWIINATNNNWHSADFNDPSVTVYQTMSAAMFKNLQFIGQDLVSAINMFDHNKFNKAEVTVETED